MKEEKEQFNRTLIIVLMFVGVMFIGSFLFGKYFESINYEEGVGFCIPIGMFALGLAGLGGIIQEPRYKIIYYCSKCGARVSKDATKCPGCKVWLISME